MHDIGMYNYWMCSVSLLNVSARVALLKVSHVPGTWYLQFPW